MPLAPHPAYVRSRRRHAVVVGGLGLSALAAALAPAPLNARVLVFLLGALATLAYGVVAARRERSSR